MKPRLWAAARWLLRPRTCPHCDGTGWVRLLYAERCVCNPATDGALWVSLVDGRRY